MITHKLDELIPEKTTGEISFTLKDETGVVIPLNQIVTLKLSLFNTGATTFINSRNLQDVLNANNVTVHATSGRVTWAYQVADTAIQDTSKSIEQRIARFDWTFASLGAKVGRRQIMLQIKNLENLT